ncbi:BEL1-like homeodomain 1 [Striga asiatica]|uniref:BEL1-like homeodomain 1 n=1 Tax=Striga asiatica TaxID=4170 RepID=A0A5A7QGZ7_STRAF|nr:BEL1-like homeodomain 1 [Striga asiatica]
MWPFQGPLNQYGSVLFHRMMYWLSFGSSSSEKSPGAGSSAFFQEVRCCFCPVILLKASLPPGSHVSVGKSKLCHKGCSIDEFDPDPSVRTKFPLSRRTAVAADRFKPVWFRPVDQATEREPLNRTRFPSEIASRAELRSWIGASRLATQTRNLEELPGVKKPSSKWPPEDTMVWSPERGLPAEMVSVAKQEKSSHRVKSMVNPDRNMAHGGKDPIANCLCGIVLTASIQDSLRIATENRSYG